MKRGALALLAAHSQHSPFRRINIAISVCDLGTALRRMSIRFFAAEDLAI
jgi:hypothetical protein